MKKIFGLLFALMASVSMFAIPVQQDISLNASDWNWSWNCIVTNNGNLLDCTLTGEFGMASIGWNPAIDFSNWDRIIVVVENMSGCDSEDWKLKAFLRDDSENIYEEIEGQLGLDADDNTQNNLVIDLHKATNVDLTHVKILHIQCQPNGAHFTISRVYLEKDVVVFDWANQIGSISLVGNVTETTVKTQTNTMQIPCISFANGYSVSEDGTATNYAEISIEGGFKAGDVVVIDYCYNNTQEKVATVAVYDTSNVRLMESANGVNGRLVDGVSTFQYELLADMASMRIARGKTSKTTTAITRLQVLRDSGPIKAGTPVFSVESGTYFEPFSVTLSSSVADKIFVSVNNGVYQEYTGNILINQYNADYTLSAYATYAGAANSDTVTATYQLIHARPVFKARKIYEFSNISAEEINILSYGTAEKSTYILDGKEIPSVNYTHMTNEEAGRDSFMVVSVKDYNDVTFRYKNSNNKNNVLRFAEHFTHIDSKYMEILIDDVQSGDTIVFVVTAKNSSTPQFSTDYSTACYLDPYQPLDHVDPCFTDGWVFTPNNASVDNNYGGWTNLVYIVQEGHSRVRIKETMAGFRLAKILVGAYRGCKVTTNASPSYAGSVDVAYNANYSQATMTANAHYGYRFVSWNDGNMQNPRTVFLTQDTTFTAYFVQSGLDPTHPCVWPMMMDNVTYRQNEQYVVNDFRPDSVEKWLYIWGNTYQPVEATGLNFYGNSEGYLAWKVSTLGWAGAGLCLSSESYMQSAEVLRQEIVANPNDYYLHLAIKSTDNYSYCFYIMGNEATKFGLGRYSVYDAPSSTLQNFTRDGEWYELYIPMSQYADVLSQSTIQSSTNNILVILTEGVQGAQLNLDAVYFCNTAYKNLQTRPEYTVSTSVYPADAGTVEVVYSADHSMATMTAIGSYGYHFARWNGGNTDNPRTVVLTQDTTFMAIFEHDLMQVTYIGMDGQILGVEEVPYGSTAHQVGIDADVFGYTLVGWDKDLNHVTENLTVTAIYKRDAVNGFYYLYDKKNRTAVLDREGNSYATMKTLNVPNNFIYRGIKFAVVAVGANAFENCDRLTDVVLPGNVENVYESAFSGCSDMVHLTMSANLRSIADYAFNGCKRLEDITVYAQRVPDLTATSFNAVGNKKYINVYVPDNRANYYKRDEYWSEFNIVVKSAETVDGEVSEVTVDPDETTAQFTWPVDDTAGSYTIQITKDGVVFCTLIFNANGQLTGIAFAPGRDGNKAPMATMTANGGMQFTVTGLDAGTIYAYTVTTKDTKDKVIATYEGSFETSGTMEDGISDIQSGMAPQKIMRDGQIYILRGEKVFTLHGVEVK